MIIGNIDFINFSYDELFKSYIDDSGPEPVEYKMFCADIFKFIIIVPENEIKSICNSLIDLLEKCTETRFSSTEYSIQYHFDYEPHYYLNVEITDYPNVYYSKSMFSKHRVEQLCSYISNALPNGTKLKFFNLKDCNEVTKDDYPTTVVEVDDKGYPMYVISDALICK